MSKPPIILAIESSCDDTGAAVLVGQVSKSNVTATQTVHEKYGGVVPELASRAHQQHIVPVVQEALKQAGVAIQEVDAIAVTTGPGLLGSLLVGTSFGKSLSLALNKPLLSVNHMEGHILAHFIKENEGSETPEFPFLCLTVSGGHTQLVKVTSPRLFEEIGSTIDDAVGEAFDKAAKILGFPYPGGPLIDKRAKEGNPEAFSFPEPKVPGLNFSFSGLKTSLLYFLQKQVKENPNFIEENKADICASFQHTLVTYLLKKVKKAVKQTGVKTIALAGGVSANSLLRSEFEQLAKKEGLKSFIPAFQYCTDNAAMIGITGYFMFQNQEFATLDISPSSRMAISG